MAVNPNAFRITNELWAFWGLFDAYEPTVALGGIYAAKTGYHDARNDVSLYDYSVAETADDRQGPGEKASAIDLTMSAAAMRKYTSILDAAAKRKDPRLFIGGHPVLREFIGTKDSTNVYCYVLTGGRARGLPADASEDWNRDSTHLWHLHLSIIRRFVGVARTYDGLISIMRGESLADWNARTGAASPEQEKEDDEMVMTSYQIPRGIAYDGADTHGENVLTILTEPVGLKSNTVVGGKSMYLSYGGDDIPEGGVTIRVAIHDGGGYASIKTYLVKNFDGRKSATIPAAVNGDAFKIVVGRVAPAGDSIPEGYEDCPLSFLVTVA